MIMFSCPNWQVFIVYFFLIKLSNFYQQFSKRFKSFWISVDKYFVPLYYFAITLFFIVRNNYI